MNLEKITLDVIAEVGGAVKVAEIFDISSQAVSQWDRIPTERVLELEKNTSYSRYEMRPDIYGDDPKKTPARNG